MCRRLHCPPLVPRPRFHVQRFFAVLDTADVDKYSTHSPDVPFSHNIAVGKLPLTNTSLHFHNIEAGVLRGTCLWVDFPFPAFPENMGHWAEALLPIYSALTNGSWAATAGLAPEAAHLSSVIFPNLRREQVKVRSAGDEQKRELHRVSAGLMADACKLQGGWAARLRPACACVVPCLLCYTLVLSHQCPTELPGLRGPLPRPRT